MVTLRYFHSDEFTRCTPFCNISDMNKEFLVCLDNIRHVLGRPIVLNSAFRSVDYEKQHGRSGTSSHCKGLAVDIRCTDSNYRHQLILSAFKCGISRIGIASTYVHLDFDLSKPQNVIWTY